MTLEKHIYCLSPYLKKKNHNNASQFELLDSEILSKFFFLIVDEIYSL